MAVTYSKLFEPNQVDSAALETLFTLPVSPATTLLRNGRVRFTNTTAGAVAITCHAVPAGVGATDTTAIIKAYSISGNSYIDIDLPVMKAGDFVQAIAGAAASISAHMIDGVLFS